MAKEQIEEGKGRRWKLRNYINESLQETKERTGMDKEAISSHFLNFSAAPEV